MSLATKHPFLLLFPVVPFVGGWVHTKPIPTPFLLLTTLRNPTVRCPSPRLFSFVLPVWGSACAVHAQTAGILYVCVSLSCNPSPLPWFPAETTVAGVHISHTCCSPNCEYLSSNRFFFGLHEPFFFLFFFLLF
ncbi:hypothetical protein CORC01_04390 [Colletotrichum orchidophilum]|uniref:Secreted protein n=1 Tax=Colletotrichum orchidophilum TaxID=1209926 RepID=A0A1G4BGA3_9PEZI|nr:uncharacterized protein CORC01_04390 [Colletotrichum orchidophilum]OHF00409.1 hypothetical protein CORC01_04390 [Colletotrichum orchidophilum]